jgi:hypothetical protein
MADYAGACHRAALRADPVGFNPPYALDELCEITHNLSWFDGLTSRGPLIWRGTSKIDFMAFPPTVQREMGYGLFMAQMGERHSTMPRRLAASAAQPWSS